MQNKTVYVKPKKTQNAKHKLMHKNWKKNLTSFF